MYLGIDCGTQGTKALLVDDEGRALGRGYARHELIVRDKGAREQEPQWWVSALRDAVKQALSQVPGAPVLALGVSGQQHGLVVLDKQMEVIRPAKLWNDTESAPDAAWLIKRHAITVLSFRDTEIEQITFFWSTDAFTGFDLPERIAP